jgi:SAM-dependent methyltransferase
MSSRPSSSPDTGLAGDQTLQTAALEDLGAAPVYQSWLCDLASEHLGDDPVELGSGNGDYAARWLEAGLERITLTEIDPSRRAALERRFSGDARVTIGAVDLAAPHHAGHSCLVSFNVLEHIRDDLSALTVAHSIVRPGGYVVHFVPAFPIAMSRFDRDIGHYRRYRRKRLVAMTREAGLELEQAHYVNMPGLVAWFVMMRLLRRRPAPGPLLWFWDRIVIRTERRLEAVVRAPFGQSVLLVARVPDRAPR